MKSNRGDVILTGILGALSLIFFSGIILVSAAYAQTVSASSDSASSTSQIASTSPFMSAMRSSVEKTFRNRIRQYSVFEAALASSTISSDDQALLSGEINGTITDMQTSIALLGNATDTKSLIQDERQGSTTVMRSDALLEAKMSLLKAVFRIVSYSPETASSASSTETLVPNPLISADIVHQIINTSSLSDISALNEGIFAVLFPKTANQ